MSQVLKQGSSLWLWLFLLEFVLVLFLPLSGDQVTLLSFGRMMEKRMVPYRGFHDINFPVTFFLHELIASLCGIN